MKKFIVPLVIGLVSAAVYDKVIKPRLGGH